ncbi:MAG: cytochrome d ubiquinol oxidase subunit II [Candidatus Competibacteraceae bacterium]
MHRHFLASFTGLALSVYPYLIPPAITLHQAASSSHTLVFMLTGIGILMPIMLIYNGYQYLVFRGKVRAEGYAE